MDNNRSKGKEIYEEPSETVSGEASNTEYVRVVTLDDYENEVFTGEASTSRVEENEGDYEQWGQETIMTIDDCWDWRDYYGVIGPVVDQRDQATCWAVAIVRAVQALLNIGVVMQQQLELSMQHIVNHVTFDAQKGISNIKNALSFMKSPGVCLESQCSSRGRGRQLVRKNCTHPPVINYHRVDSFTHLTDIEDADLEAIVRRQPVIGLIPFNGSLLDYDHTRNLIYQHDRTQDGPNPPVHNVLIVGFERRNGRPCWIVQNSWGKGWGDGGYAYVYRQPIRGRSISQFHEIIIPNKRDHPRSPGPNDGA
ncbi:hypothetical protein Bca52824_004432 [Brassica carinata]|uniref:Peptidase C1A papain C-terminal domain-containing protein n=1 Tax=Brassica carinata TaxID=52824 RepID=A0A8X8BGS1_BRACI|nr:hypothetical protein Bca52824_004432 [Brassica carinata]